MIRRFFSQSLFPCFFLNAQGSHMPADMLLQQFVVSSLLLISYFEQFVTEDVAATVVLRVEDIPVGDMHQLTGILFMKVQKPRKVGVGRCV